MKLFSGHELDSSATSLVSQLASCVLLTAAALHVHTVTRL